MECVLLRLLFPPHRTGIAEPGMLWLDTYFEWIAPSSKCCGISREKNNTFCLKPQFENDTCDSCVKNLTEKGWPLQEDFGKYLPWFLQDNPGVRCPSGGHAAFAGAVKLNPDNKTVNSESETRRNCGTFFFNRSPFRSVNVI